MFLKDDGQNTFEYVLILGGVVVTLAASFFAFDAVIEQVVGHACPGVDTANGLSAVGSCLTKIGP